MDITDDKSDGNRFQITIDLEMKWIGGKKGTEIFKKPDTVSCTWWWKRKKSTYLSNTWDIFNVCGELKYFENALYKSKNDLSTTYPMLNMYNYPSLCYFK